MSEGGEPSAPATPGLLHLSYTTPRDAAHSCTNGYSMQHYHCLRCYRPEEFPIAHFYSAWQSAFFYTAELILIR